MLYTIRPMQEKDVLHIAQAFASWGKQQEQYERYWQENQEGKRITLVALCDNEIAGYTNVVWQPEYMPFRTEGIPEINDMNVLAPFRRQGIASRFIAESEHIVLRAGYSVIGIGFGLTADYGAAQRLYPKLGYFPDGRGVYSTPWGDVLYLTKNLLGGTRVQSTASEATSEQRYRANMTQVRVLLSSIASIEQSERWLYSPQQSLGGTVPRDLIRQEQTARVLEAIRVLTEGIHV